MADDRSAAGDPAAGRSDLFARIQDLQDDVDNGLSAAQVQDAVRGAVAALLPGLVSDAVSSALEGALPSVAQTVAAEVAEHLSVPDADGIEARLAALEDALDGVVDRFESLTRDQASATAASFDELRAQLVDLRDPPPSEAPHDVRQVEIDALREDLADALDYVRTTLAAEVTARAVETQSAVRALSGSLGAAGPQDVQLILDRLDALPHELPALDLSPVHDQLAALAAAEPLVDPELLTTRLDAIEQALSDTDLGPVQRKLDDLAATLAASPDGAEDLEALHVRFDGLLAAVDGAADAARDRQAVEVERLRAAVLEAAELLPQVVDARAADIAAAVTEQLLDVRTDLATTAGETLSVLAHIRDRPQLDIAGRLDAVAADVGRLAGAPAPVDPGDRLDALSAGLAGVDDRVDGVQGRLADLDDRIEALQSELVDAVDRGHSALVDQLASVHDDVRTRMVEDAGTRRDAVEAVRESQEATIARLERIGEHPLLSGAIDIGRELGDLRALLTGLSVAQEQAASAGREEARRADETAAERGQELHDQVEALRSQLRAAVDGLPPQIEAWRTQAAEDRERLTAALSGLESARDEMAALIGRIGDQGDTAAATVRAASLAALEQLSSDSAVSAAELRRDAEAARARLDEQADTSRQGVIDGVRTAASAALDDVRAAITGQELATAAATREMEQIARRVHSAGRLVVAYLSERDAALEEIRDRDTVQLLEDVLSALSRKDREKAASETRGILARRRESRQAERWRQHQQENVHPEAQGDGESVLEALDALVPDPSPEQTPPAGAVVLEDAAGPGDVAAEPAAEEPEAPKTAASDSAIVEGAGSHPAASDPAVPDPEVTEPAVSQEPMVAPPKPAPKRKASARKAPVKKATARKASSRQTSPRPSPAKKATTKRVPELPAGAPDTPAD